MSLGCMAILFCSGWLMNNRDRVMYTEFGHRNWLRPFQGVLGFALAFAGGFSAKWLLISAAQSPEEPHARAAKGQGAPGSQPRVPPAGLSQLVLRNGPAGALQLVAAPHESPNRLFLYPGLTLKDNPQLATSGSLEKAWVYGVELHGQLAVVTADIGDVLEGQLITWPAHMAAEKLELADRLVGYKSSAHERGSVGRNVVGTVLSDGSTKFAHFYYKKSQSPNKAELVIALDKFAKREWDPSKPNHITYDPELFIAKVNAFYQSQLAQGLTENQILREGYAPFCKHLFMPNFAKLSAISLPITAENEVLLRTKYEARKANELPVLVRYFPKEKLGAVPEAVHLDLILYSREQIRKENEAMGDVDSDVEPWALISVKPQMEDFETPMQPITMLRNALGKDQGGSGVPLDRAKYFASVDYWSKHAPIA
eukprot:g76274.t1